MRRIHGKSPRKPRTSHNNFWQPTRWPLSSVGSFRPPSTGSVRMRLDHYDLSESDAGGPSSPPPRPAVHPLGTSGSISRPATPLRASWEEFLWGSGATTNCSFTACQVQGSVKYDPHFTWPERDGLCKVLYTPLPHILQHTGVASCCSLKHPLSSSLLQPLDQGRARHHNGAAGHAFRSLTVHILEIFGDPDITYAEEISPYDEFPGQEFTTRSHDPKMDIVGRRGNVTVALISSRWRFRHDRVDVVEEAMAYVTAARRHNSSCRLYASVGEFAPNRLKKILDNCPPAQPHGPLTAAVHFAPQLITGGLEEDGRMAHLQSLDWLIGESFSW